MNELEFTASRLRTQIRTAKRKDHFFDAEQLEAKLQIIENQIKNEQK